MYQQHRTVTKGADWKRIIALPERTYSQDDIKEMVQEMTARLKTPEGTWTLFPLQAIALYEAFHSLARGLIIPIPVGGGKTLVSLLLPVVWNDKRPCLFLPAGLVEKTKRERAELSKQFKVSRNLHIQSYEMMGRVGASQFLDRHGFTTLILDETHKIKNDKAACTRRFSRYMGDRPDTRMAAMSGTLLKNSLDDFGHVMAWALKEGAPIPLHKEDRKLWAQALADEKNFLKVTHPGPLLELPESPRETGEEDEKTLARLRVQHKFSRTPGIITGDPEELGCSLSISGTIIQPSQTTQKHFEKLRTEWQTPDGWTVSEAMQVWRHAQELALGFHYTWFDGKGLTTWLQVALKKEESRLKLIELRILRDFVNMIESGESLGRNQDLLRIREAICSNTDTGLPPSNTKIYCDSKEVFVKFANEEKIQESLKIFQWTIATPQGGFAAFCAACAIEPLEILAILWKRFPALCAILKEGFKRTRPPEDWLKARKDWAQFVRNTILFSHYLDSEKAVAMAVEAGELRTKTYQVWRDIRPTFKVNSVMRWHDDTALNYCKKWAETNSGIIWTSHTFFARELERRIGCDYFGRDGVNSKGQFIEDVRKGDTIIASIAANGTGRNLQYKWHKNLITCLPAGATVNEQLLGRTHRTGQTEDEVYAEIMFACAENVTNWGNARREAENIHQLLDQKQKLLYADITLPEFYTQLGPVWDKTIKKKFELPKLG